MNRGGPLKRGSMRRTPTPRRQSEVRVVGKSKVLIWERCQGKCEMCGKTIERNNFEYAHRQQKGMGGYGVNTPSNGLASCPGPDGCNQKCSDGRYTREEAVRNGWIIPRGVKAPPSDFNVWIAHQWWLLNDDGSKQPWT